MKIKKQKKKKKKTKTWTTTKARKQNQTKYSVAIFYIQVRGHEWYVDLLVFLPLYITGKLLLDKWLLLRS